MAVPVIEVTALSKRYRIGTRRAPYKTLRESIAGILSGTSRRLRREAAQEESTFWALRDVSFHVERGEALGIIGRNGAGKTTLLKILSRITEPTEGEARIWGRVGSLLEVGTGFHPELTGRENIFLNGAILGMRRHEVRRTFDEIVAFAEVERFLDTPVKRYSSGMYVRLAFAVAAHLEPEILFVDEVLAVGDVAFQKKCLGKMHDVARSGRTVILVSHNLAAIEHTCSRAILLERGGVLADGRVGEVLSAYLSVIASTGASGQLTAPVGTVKLRLLDAGGRETDVLRAGERMTFLLEIALRVPIALAGVGIGVVTPAGDRIVTFHSHFQCRSPWPVRERCVCSVEWPENFLCPGPYRLVIALYDGAQLIASWDNAGCLTVIASDFYATGRHPDPTHQGHVMARARWDVSADGDEVVCQP